MAKGAAVLPEVLKVGINEMEVIVFKMYAGDAAGALTETNYYGVNVAKVREIIPMPVLTIVPDMPDYADAIAEVRGQVIPIIYLDKWMKLLPSKDANIKQKVIVLEMLGTTVGMVVHDVERIRRVKWDIIKPPPQILQAKHGGKITGVVKIDNQEGALLLILDLEGIISDIGSVTPHQEVSLEGIEKTGKRQLKGNVLIVDDSAVARKILKDTLENAGLTIIEAVDGRQALNILTEFIDKIGQEPITDFIQLVISDVEMPEMDGLTFVNNVKSEPRLNVLPIIINTSLSGEENREKAKLVGADGYLVKFDVVKLINEVSRFFK